MSGIVLHRQRLAPAIRVDQLNHYQPVIADAVRFCYSQRVALDGLDGTPDVDDLHAAFEQLLRFVGEVVRHTRQCCGVGLVNVHALHWAPEGFISTACARLLAADGVIEDEDAGGAGAGDVRESLI